MSRADDTSLAVPFLLRFARTLPIPTFTWGYDQQRQLNVLADGTPAVEAIEGAELVKTVQVIGEE